MDFSNLPPFIVDKFICNEPCGILWRGEWKRGTEAKCKNEIWQRVCSLVRLFWIKKGIIKKFFSFLYLSLKEKHTKFSRGLSFLCGMPFQFICKGTKRMSSEPVKYCFRNGSSSFLCLLCGLEGLQLLALWVNWGCFSTWFLLLFERDFFYLSSDGPLLPSRPLAMNRCTVWLRGLCRFVKLNERFCRFMIMVNTKVVNWHEIGLSKNKQAYFTISY